MESGPSLTAPSPADEDKHVGNGGGGPDESDPVAHKKGKWHMRGCEQGPFERECQSRVVGKGRPTA